MDDSNFLTRFDPSSWRLNPKVNLHWRHLDDSWVVFEVLSGETHQLDHSTAAVLMCFEPGQALTAPQLLGALRSDFSMLLPHANSGQADRALAGHPAIAAALDQFIALGLIIQVPLRLPTHAVI